LFDGSGNNFNFNVAIGGNALNKNSAANNTAVGYFALSTNTTGSNNSAVGSFSLLDNTTGSFNTAIGYDALANNTTGSSNTAIGWRALDRNTNGNNNVAIGYEAGDNHDSNNNCTFIGYIADSNNNNVSNSTAIGYFSRVTASNQMVLGDGNVNVFIPGGSATYSTAYKLQAGGVVAGTSFFNTSDYRIKENVKTLDNSFNVDQLRPVTYNNKEIEGKQDIGLIAHELQEVFPFLVLGEKDGEHFQTVNYTGLIGILIKEIQELKSEVKILKNEVKNLK
jgi:hypothetical protein